MAKCECPTEAHNTSCPEHPEAKRFERIRELADEQHADEKLSIDGDAVVSEGDDNGAYVQVWAWVEFAGTELDKETGR